MISVRLVDFGDSQTVRKGVEGMNMSTQSHPGLLLSYVLVTFFWLRFLFAKQQKYLKKSENWMDLKMLILIHPPTGPDFLPPEALSR